jgi:hypothetical protein
MAICHQWSWRGFEVNTKDNAENGVLVTGLEWRRVDLCGFNRPLAISDRVSRVYRRERPLL